MKKITILLSVALISVLLLAGCETSDKEKSTEIDLRGFCGSSTLGPCDTDADCVTGGCSGQVCQSTSEEQVITTCEFAECYDDEKYGVNCGCVNNKCQWRK